MAAIYGNYHGYYTKRPSLKDPRLALLPPTFFTDKTVLDIGCNEGWVTCEIAHAWGARHVIGVDLDDTLVRAAWKHRRTLWSLQSPRFQAPDRPAKKQRTRPNSDPDPDVSADVVRPDYFPASCEHTHGPLPIPATTDDAFPHNVTFRTADWATDTNTNTNTDTDAATGAQDTAAYDIVIAFSITKWIHLHHGDDGLAGFFRRVHRVLKTGGVLILEPQAWETYGKARRMDPRLRENAKRLELRPHDFPALLEKLGFEPPRHLGTPGQGGFHRPVDLYTKK